jgi:hypothetical protein
VLLVPATPPTTGLVWTRGQATALAEWRMNEAIERLRALGANIRGVVGDGRALDAIDDILQEERFDEIVLSTLPVGASRWLRQDLPHRLRRRYEIPVRHVVDTSRGMADPLVRIERVLRVAS